MVLTAPIASILSLRRKISMSSMAAFTGLGLFLTHGLVPPTPGILAIALMYGADLGLTIFWGTIISAIAFFGTWLLLRGWCAKEWIAPREDFVEGFEPAKSDAVEELVIHEPNLPGSFMAFLPVLIPVVLITFASFAKVSMDEGGAALPFFTSVGDRVIALLLGVAFTVVLGFIKADKVMAHHKRVTGDDGESLKHIIFNSWVARGLVVALLPLLITAMGGAMGATLKAAPVIKELGALVTSSNILPIPGPVSDRRDPDDRRGLHDHRRSDRRGHHSAHDGFFGPVSSGGDPVHRGRYHDGQPSEQQRFLDHVPVLQSEHQTGRQVHHRPVRCGLGHFHHRVGDPGVHGPHIKKVNGLNPKGYNYEQVQE